MARNASNSGKTVKRLFVPLLLASSILLAGKPESQGNRGFGETGDLTGGRGYENKGNHGVYPGGASQVPGIALSTSYLC